MESHLDLKVLTVSTAPCGWLGFSVGKFLWSDSDLWFVGIKAVAGGRDDVMNSWNSESELRFLQ